MEVHGLSVIVDICSYLPSGNAEVLLLHCSCSSSCEGTGCRGPGVLRYAILVMWFLFFTLPPCVASYPGTSIVPSASVAMKLSPSVLSCKSKYEQVARVRTYNYVKFKTGQTLSPLLKIVTRLHSCMQT